MTSMGQQLADLWDTPTDYSTDPVAWCSDRGGEYMYAAQREIMQSVVEHRYTAVHSAHDMGKSKVAANLVTWWIDSHPPGTAFVVTTAPTAAQVSAILWREVGKMKLKTETKGRINRAGYPQWYIGDVLVGYGRKPADYEESAFQGIHERYVLVILDEACGIAKHLFDAVDALATNEYARVLAIGNPDDPGSHFGGVVCKPGSGWNVIHLDGLRSPNLTYDRVVGPDPENPKYPLLKTLMEVEGIPFATEAIPEDIRPLLISELWIEERIKRWGGVPEDAQLVFPPDQLRELVSRRCASSPIFQAKVRGVFPDSGSGGVIPLGWIELAINRWHDLMDGDKYPTEVAPSLRAPVSGRKVIGVDVARGGEDETAIAIRYGSLCTEIRRYRQADTTETADTAAAHLHEPGSIAVVDVVGVGGGVFDLLRRYKREGMIVGTPLPFTASAQSGGVDATGEFKFRNDRSAAWWRMRELLDPSRGSVVAIPDDEMLKAELCAPHFRFHIGGILVVESKEEIKKRIGRSTDSADAVIQAFWADGGGEMPKVQEFQPAKHAEYAVYSEGYLPFVEDDMNVGPGIQGRGWGSRDMPDWSDL